MNLKELLLRARRTIRDFFLDLDDHGIANIWAAGILILGFLFWLLWPRAALTAGAVNQTLQAQGESWRLEEPLRPFGWRLRNLKFGEWYTARQVFPTEEGGKESVAVVFSLFSDGLFKPCLALCAEAGSIERFIPLSPDTALLLSGSEEAGRHLEIWKARIESSAALLQKALAQRVKEEGQ